MTRTVNVHEAKTHLSRLLEGVEHGEDIVIARNGKPIARLVPATLPQRTAGAWAGQVWIADDFDQLPEHVLAAFNDPVEPTPSR